MSEPPDVQALLNRVREQAQEIEQLRAQLGQRDQLSSRATDSVADTGWPLQQGEYRRYGRQMILQEVGLQGRHRSNVIFG